MLLRLILNSLCSMASLELMNLLPQPPKYLGLQPFTTRFDILIFQCMYPFVYFYYFLFSRDNIAK